jgi:Co/Zn/Cd efflux system component
MSSVWLCSQNDLVANVGVLLAAAGSYLLASRWPDIIVGGIIASLFLGSALNVLSQAIRHNERHPPRRHICELGNHAYGDSQPAKIAA